MKGGRKGSRWLAVLILLLPLSGRSLNLFEYRNAQELPSYGLPVKFYSNVVTQEFAPLPTKEQGVLASHFPTLKVGILCCIGAPLVIHRWDGKLEGIYADYLRLIETVLKRPVEVRLFGNWESAYAALQRGDIQLLSHSASPQPGNRKDDTYPILVQPLALIVRKEQVNKPFEQMNIMAAPGSNPNTIEQLRKHYRSVLVAKNQQEGVQAVVDGEVDAYLDGQSQIAYLLAFRPFTKLTYRRDISQGERYDFLARNGDGIVEAINLILTAIPHETRNKVYQRWVSGLALSDNNDTTIFSPQEKAWVKKNPVVNVAISRTAPPYSFLDKDGQLAGLDVDILRLLGEKSGITFNFIPADGAVGIKKLLQDGEAQMTSLVDTPERRRWLSFSHPYGTVEWVMITRNERNAPYEFEQLKHHRVAIQRGHALLSVLKQYPEIFVMEVDNVTQGVDMVLAGAADATFDSLISADYLQASHYGTNISIQFFEGSLQPEQYAIIPAYPQLVDILNKSIDALPPNELRVLRLKWLSMGNVTAYADNKISPWMKLWGGALFVIALSSAFWGSYLAHQIRRRKRAENNLQDLLTYWETLFNNMPTPMFVCDPTMCVTAANLYFRREMNTLGSDVIGRSLFSLCFLKPADEKDISMIFLRCLEGAPAHFSDRSIAIQGQDRDVYLWLESYSNTEGVVQGIIGGWFDVTERKLLAQELRQERDKAELASLEKSDFLAHMSHEIRTPLQAIIGILDLEVKQQTLPSTPLHIAWHAAMSLQGIIGDVLDFSKIESGRMVLNLEPESLQEVLGSCVVAFSHRAKEKGLFFARQFDLPSEYYHLLDATRVTQVVNNLLGNAIKFTEQGGVQISASYRHIPESNQDEITLVVADTGCGVPETMYEAVLLPYVQVTQNCGGKTGTGLGLPISVQLVEFMGGSLKITGAPGGGTQVTVTLPLMRSIVEKEAVSEKTENIEGEIHESLNILVVDDLPANLQVLSLQLAPSGHHVVLAESGEQAMNLMEEGYFDLVLTDCQMPVMNGYELAQLLRKHERLRQLPPFIILGCTANAFSTEQARCLDAGMDGVLTKPLVQSKLLAEINRYYRQVNDEITLQFDEIQALAQRDVTVEHQLLSAVWQGMSEDIAELRQPENQQIDEKVTHHAHRMKGAFALLQYQQGIRICLRIEKGERYDEKTIEVLLTRAEYFQQQIKQQLEKLQNVNQGE
ncbi:transporter substrate-binding domain-containing protein [Photorhabdus thracensis]|uniref:transporter substrate-binding domain-containing protein n=1 Tax=Photorhabdus thracensis TaxID=230089 RepID=UPI001E4F0E27|nr:transporter substrate-binding domain-containing protein [Photorhabdus thracensis]MCC8421331.1 transporter substrate-binding domain-containing protein [Photorhabdus thracensis]